MTRPLPIFKTGSSMAHKILGGWSLDGVGTYTSGSDLYLTCNPEESSHEASASIYL
jgi:hypothetical protein